MNYKDKFYSKYVSSHTREIYGEMTLARIRLEFPILDTYFARFLPDDKNVEVLDIGCGNGGLVLWLQEKGFKNTVGVDLSGEQVEETKKLGIKGVIKSDLREFLKSKKDFYDVIFARDVLEHFTKEDVLNILELVNKSLKRGGVLIVQTVNAENFLWGRLRHADFTHDLAFTRESIRQIMLINGFREVKTFPQRPVVHGLISFFRYVFWRYFECLLHFYLLVETGSHTGIFTQNLIAVAEK